MDRILLIEPAYKNKFPPIGLMKLATFHKIKGDEVYFYKGVHKALLLKKWDIVYISTLFSFDWNITLKTIDFYGGLLEKGSKVIIGGIMAELMRNELKDVVNRRIIFNDLSDMQVDGELIKSMPAFHYMLTDKMLLNIYNLPPDYGIFGDQVLPYKEAVDTDYFFSTTKGCTRDCEFCAVNKLTKISYEYLPLVPKIEYIIKTFGERRNLILLDDNLLQSSKFDRIIDEIKDCGFHRDAKLNGKKRYVDFNQGLDLRLLDKHHIARLSEIALKPLRLALDKMKLCDMFSKKVKWLNDAGFRNISVYMLFNYKDEPVDLYKRLELCVNLNERYGTRIYSFPMKYAPIDLKNRSYIGCKWTKRQLRGVQCILNASSGNGPRTLDFFQRAYGSSVEEFEKLILMPENYIIYRNRNSENGNLRMWQELYSSLDCEEKGIFKKAIGNGKTKKGLTGNLDKVNELLQLYNNEYHGGITGETP